MDKSSRHDVHTSLLLLVRSFRWWVSSLCRLFVSDGRFGPDPLTPGKGSSFSLGPSTSPGRFRVRDRDSRIRQSFRSRPRRSTALFLALRAASL